MRSDVVELVLVKHVGHANLTVCSASQPTIQHLASLEVDNHVITVLNHCVLSCIGGHGILVKAVFGWFRELIPEEGLHGVEVQTVVAHEIYLDIGSLQVLFVDTVHNQDIVRRQFNTSCLHETKGHQLQANTVVTFHFQVTCECQFLCANFHRELHLRGDKLLSKGILLHFANETLSGQLLSGQRFVFNYGLFLRGTRTQN